MVSLSIRPPRGGSGSAGEPCGGRIKTRFIVSVVFRKSPSAKSGAHIQFITPSPMVLGASPRWAAPLAKSNETTKPTPQKTIIFSVSTST
jgi:hypothetical protein